MNFIYEFEKESGVKAEAVEVGSITLDPRNGKGSAELFVYVDAESKAAGKQHEILHHVRFTFDKEDEKLLDLLPVLQAKIEAQLELDKNPPPPEG